MLHLIDIIFSIELGCRPLSKFLMLKSIKIKTNHLYQYEDEQ